MAQWRKRGDVHNGAVTPGGVRMPLPARRHRVMTLGRPVVLVHGWPDTHHLWTHVAPLLAGDFRVIAYDCRGFGDSDRPDGDDLYRLSEMADDLFAVITTPAQAPDKRRARPRPRLGIGTHLGGRRTARRRRIASFVSVSGPSLDQLWRVGAGRSYVGRRPAIWRAMAQTGSSALPCFPEYRSPGLFFSYRVRGLFQRSFCTGRRACGRMRCSGRRCVRT